MQLLLNGILTILSCFHLLIFIVNPSSYSIPWWVLFLVLNCLSSARLFYSVPYQTFLLVTGDFVTVLTRNVKVALMPMQNSQKFADKDLWEFQVVSLYQLIGKQFPKTSKVIIFFFSCTCSPCLCLLFSIIIAL